ncbi:membrane protein insertase YidC [Solihabitans fulvus]|uniref:Membrane protein insertase YidC n=1 Tax=Solihabitans fulvus TaxID=1892852 RepID=A0A5B2XKW8_9PSEU|nr:membrane protein insertase YidC [Solihabitans fulvus]KAA2263755.1 membrane protein insertase YidC [Solihabitans fulvus]
MLDIIYYPVSFILWCWHWVFSHVFGPSSGVAWALAVIFLVFTLRAVMFKPFVSQVRSMRKMQEFAPELQKIKKKYANDRQKQAAEMQKLQSEHGVNPLGGCLPMLLQVPVFIGLNHVIRSFVPGQNENYFFDKAGVDSFVHAKLFGANLLTYIGMKDGQLDLYSTTRTAVIFVCVPLMIVASIATHFTARHSVARQQASAAENPQTAIMNKLTMYIFPLGVLAFGAFFPIGLLLYWLANNGWTLAQQHVVYRKIDAEEDEKKSAAVAQRQALAPKPGQKPSQVKKRPAADATVADATVADAKSGDAKAADAKLADAKAADVKSGDAKSGDAAGSVKKTANGQSPEIPGLISDHPRGKKQGNKKRR